MREPPPRERWGWAKRAGKGIGLERGSSLDFHGLEIA